jgi:hypothetical protein
MGGSGLGRQSSYTQVSASGPRGVAAGKRRAVFCDVVVDELELDEHGSCVYPPGECSIWVLEESTEPQGG